MSGDDTFTGGLAGHVRRIAEQREAERQRMEEQARADAVAIEQKARLYAEQMRQELLACRSVSVPEPAPTPAPEPQPDLNDMSMDEYAAWRRTGCKTESSFGSDVTPAPAPKTLGTGRYWTEGGLERDSKPE
jgi:hypothetical protein